MNVVINYCCIRHSKNDYIYQANQDLALEKVPVEGEREIKVGFKAKLVETSSLSDLSASKSDDDYEE